MRSLLAIPFTVFLLLAPACSDDADPNGASGDGGPGSEGGGPGSEGGGLEPDAGPPWLVCPGETPNSGQTCATPPALKLVELPHSFTIPVLATSSRCDPSRLYVLEKGGLIRLVKGDAISTFLDLQSLVLSNGLSEGGLLGLAFHPDYENNGRFFIHYSAKPNGRTKVVEYKRSADPDKADPTPVRTLVDAQQRGDQHVGGTVAFGRDGALYASFGDFGTGANAQDMSSVHGKILRFDVDNPPATPLDSGGAVAQYVFALGLRNPYRFSFDRANGTIFIADVGEATFEEVNVGPALASGRNYGWPDIEGPCPGGNCNGTIGPVKAHARTDDEMGARSIIGGHVYRGKAIPCLNGFYIYGDYNYEPRAWVLRWDGAGGTVGEVKSVQKDLFGGFNPQPSLVAFGEDAAGELYVVDANGKVFRIEAE